MVTCFDAGIKSDIRFALPNRLSRIGTRSEGAKLATSELRARFSNRPLLLTTPGSVNWRTGGLSDAIDVTTSSDPVWVLDCDEGHALITTEIEAPRLEADFGVQALGWDVLTVPWYDAHAPLTTACSYAHVDSTHLLSDTDAFGTKVRNGLVMSRLVLGEAERDEMRELGVLVGAALGAGIDAWRPGITTDFESAATISRALEADGAKAVCLIVGGDDRLRSFRHPMAVGNVLNDAIMAVVVARRAGLHVAATRICVSRSDDEIVTLMKTLALVDDAVLGASLPGGSWGETVGQIASSYASIGHAGAWREHFQGGPIGFEQREFEIAPPQRLSPFWDLTRSANTAVAWNPSLAGGAKIEETYLVGDDTLELLTPTPEWPMIEGAHGVLRSDLKVLT